MLILVQFLHLIGTSWDLSKFLADKCIIVKPNNQYPKPYPPTVAKKMYPLNVIIAHIKIYPTNI